WMQDEVKGQKKLLHTTATSNEVMLKASSLLCLWIAKGKLPFKVGEELIMPLVVDSFRKVLSEAAAKK
ncbi:hypothetical protein KIL84_015694, partial [Mauremys mutica]